MYLDATSNGSWKYSFLYYLYFIMIAQFVHANPWVGISYAVENCLNIAQVLFLRKHYPFLKCTAFVFFSTSTLFFIVSVSLEHKIVSMVLETIPRSSCDDAGGMPRYQNVSSYAFVSGDFGSW